MIRILCTGDSHTWGEGVSGMSVGIYSEFDPPAVCGELRLANFCTDGYVNVLRRELERATGSYSKEWEAKDIAAMQGAGFCKPCAVIKNKEISIPFRGAMLRMQCRLGEIPTMPEIIIDGRHQEVFELPPAQNENDYRILTFLLEEGEHHISIGTRKGELLIYRLESYGGPCAVINSGVGSCPVQRYIEHYWSERVENVKPNIVVAEAHTINDWLTQETTEEYYQHLVTMIEKYRAIGAEVILVTVSPVLGQQSWNENQAQYSEYVEMSRRAAKDSDIFLCDANAIMKISLEGMDENTVAKHLFGDNWHPNERGHAFYAELIKQMVLPMCLHKKEEK